MLFPQLPHKPKPRLASDGRQIVAQKIRPEFICVTEYFAPVVALAFPRAPVPASDEAFFPITAVAREAPIFSSSPSTERARRSSEKFLKYFRKPNPRSIESDDKKMQRNGLF
jgi:hypothetical protein